MVILLRSRLKYLNFEVYIDFCDAACGKRNIGNDISRVKYILYWALPAHRINGLWNRPCVILLNYFAIERYITLVKIRK